MVVKFLDELVEHCKVIIVDLAYREFICPGQQFLEGVRDVLVSLLIEICAVGLISADTFESIIHDLSSLIQNDRITSTG